METVEQIKKLETDVANRKAALRSQILAQIEAHIAELSQLGFLYALSENGTPKKSGRPRKGMDVGQK